MLKVQTQTGEVVPGLLRDEGTGVILSTDKTAYNRYLTERQRVLNNKQEMEDLKSKVDRMESSLEKILKLLEK